MPKKRAHQVELTEHLQRPGAYDARARSVYWNTATSACRAKGPHKAMCLLEPEHAGSHYGNGYDAYGPLGAISWDACREYRSQGLDS